MHLEMIKTSSEIEQVQSQPKNQCLKKIEKSNSIDLLSSGDHQKHEWTLDEENVMFQLHNQHGNKWAIIAEQLQGRTDNSVKNHFYSRLRKGLRKLNKTINLSFEKSVKQFKIIDLYKVIEASDEKFKENKTEQNQFAEIGHGNFLFMEDLKNRLFLYAEEDSDLTEESKLKMKKLVDDLIAFTKDYKRKSKKNRRYSPMGPDSVYRNLIKNQLRQSTSKIESISEEPPAKELNPQNSKRSMVELRKTHLRKEQKSQNEEKTQKNCVQQYRKDQKKSEEKTKNLRSKNKKPYKHFSQDEVEEVKNEAEELREQKLDTFAENILKTFKSYFSFQSLQSHVIRDELFQ